ncbi:MAG: DUF5665 domain-containing protein [bacterium]|nr:DUF5665 domain-containing protein [bacterium]
MAAPRSRGKRKQPDRDADVLHKFALALERGRFIEYVETLTDTKRLLWKNFLVGLARGFGAVVGATIVVALLVALLAWIGQYLPGVIGEFFRATSEQIQSSV